MTPSPTPLAAVILGTVRIATVIEVAFVALVLLGVTIGLEPLAVPLLIVGWAVVLAVVTGSVRVKGGGA